MTMPVNLIPNRGTAEPAAVFILVPFRQNQEERFYHWHGLPAFRAVKLHGLEFAIG